MELDLATEITDLVVGVTNKWAKQRKAEERSARSTRQRAQTFRQPARYTIRAAAFETMKDAYMKASANGGLPANARQIMYAARPVIQQATGQDLDDKYFTQTLLPDYIEAYHPAWDVVYDARGHFTEPHTDRSVGLGTLNVRAYLDRVGDQHVPDPGVAKLCTRYPTSGPANRFGAILFTEKEGFDELLAAAQIAERFDIGTMSTKGMSNIASRLLVDRLPVALLVLHDFDQAGFAILGTLRRSTRRYEFSQRHTVIDLGLTLTDIERYGLEAEYQRATHSSAALRLNGATRADIAFLQADQRVELNMLTSEQFVELIETKLVDLGIEKVISDAGVLESAYRRAYQIALLNQALEAAVPEAQRRAAEAPVPDDLVDLLRARVADNDVAPWDIALAEIVESAFEPDTPR